MNRIVFTKHAITVMQLRGLDEAILAKAIRKPDMILPTHNGKHVYLKDMGKNCLKIIISEERDALVVITAYWIAKERVKR